MAIRNDNRKPRKQRKQITSLHKRELLSQRPFAVCCPRNVSGSRGQWVVLADRYGVFVKRNTVNTVKVVAIQAVLYIVHPSGYCDKEHRRTIF